MAYPNIDWTGPGRYDRSCSKSGICLPDYLDSDGLRVLDAGCSAGVETTRLAVQYPQHRFTGLDRRPDLLQVARSCRWSHGNHMIDYGTTWDENTYPDIFRLVRWGEHPELFRPEDGNTLLLLREGLDPKIRYVAGDYTRPMLSDGSFDLIIGVACGIDHRLFDEIPRLMQMLVPGGFLVTERKVRQKE